MKATKLQKCRNCFRIVSNHKYIIASGDSVTVYRQKDLSVHCTIPSKTFPHAYCCRFLSDDVVMMKNNCAEYMIYDIAQQSVLWKFKVRGYDSIDNDYLVSSDGNLVFDLLSPSNLKGTVMELIVSLQEKCYILHPLQEPQPCQDGWSRYPHIHTAKDATNGVYVAFTFGPRQPNASQIDREIVLLHKDSFGRSNYKEIQRLENVEPVSFGTKRLPSGIKYLDSEHMIFTDLQCLDLNTQQYGSLPITLPTDPWFRLERKRNPATGTSFFLLHERHYTGSSVLSLFTPFGSDTTDDRSRISLFRIPDCKYIETFEHVDGTDDWEIYDIEFLDDPNRLLIGTMSGIYLCER